MKRDLDLIRTLLLEIEEKDDESGEIISLADEFNLDEKLVGHLRLLVEAGLVDAEESLNQERKLNFLVYRVTWQGHDFLDSVRDDEIWKMTKDGAMNAGGFSVDLLKAIAKGYLKKKIKDQTGIDI